MVNRPDHHSHTQMPHVHDHDGHDYDFDAACADARAIPDGRYTRRRFIQSAAGAAAGLGLASVLAQQSGLGSIFSLGPTPAEAATGQALVLYDGTGDWAFLGDLHSKMMANLCGRFLPTGQTTNYTVRKPISQYVAGDVNKYVATFYIGHTYDNPLPQAFKDDVMTTTKPVVWMNFNLWQLAWDANGGPSQVFLDKFGFMFNGLVAGSYSKVTYKARTYTKSLLDPTFGTVTISNAAKAQAVATATDANGAVMPYITRANANFWYIADLPFSYMSEEDRYLVWADVLFDVFNVAPSTSKRALLRLEDVSAKSDPAELRAIADYCFAQGVPFSIAVVPLYKDPLGYYNGGVPESISINQASLVKQALYYCRQKGAEIIMHGYTHQYAAIANPYNGVTGDDFEFFRATENADRTLNFLGPVAEDSANWVKARLDAAANEMNKAKLPWVGFEAPHYAASEVDYKAFASKFKFSYHRNLYYEGAMTGTGAQMAPSTALSVQAQTTNKGNYDKTMKQAAAANSKGKSDKKLVSVTSALEAPAIRFAGQMFPYVCGRDIYGQKILPENLGNVEPVAWPDPELGPYPQRLPAAIINAAQLNLGIRDSWASFYFHPFWDIKYLKDTVAGVKGLGYRFVKPSTVVI